MELKFTEAQLAEARRELREQMMTERTTKSKTIADDIRRLPVNGEQTPPKTDKSWRVRR